MLTELQGIDGRIYRVTIGDNSIYKDRHGHVLVFSMFSHNNQGVPHFDIYHLTEKNKANDKSLIHHSVNRMPNNSWVAFNSLIRGGIGAYKGANDQSKEHLHPRESRSNIIPRAGIGALKGAALPYLLPVIAQIIGDYIPIDRHDYGEWVYTNITDYDGSVFVGPIKL